MNIEANASAATFLIQFPLLYSAIISHSALSYHFFVIPSQPSNLTVRFSQVTNEIYYAADIVTVDASNSTVSDGSVDMLAVRKAFTNIQGTPIRLEIDSRPSITGLLVNFQINAQDMIPFGSVLYTNYFALSGVLALAGVYYRFISVSSKFRLASSALLTLALFVVSVPIGSIVFVAWPPLSENFTWIFAFGLVLGALLLGLFVNYRREMT